MINKRAKKKHQSFWKNPANIIMTFCIIIGLLSTKEGILLINILLLIGMFYLFYRLLKRKRSFQKILDLSEVDKMNGLQFEHFLVPLFEKIGYNAQVTKGSGDYGADLILHKRQKKFVVQAKRYNSTIGVSAVQEIVAAMGYYNAHGSMVITNNYFTPAAENLAKANKVRLIDRDELVYMINKERKVRNKFIPS
ncbi:restriction endonuclease [Paenibacillus alvei]